MGLTFYLGTHRGHWLELTETRLFVSRFSLSHRGEGKRPRRKLPRALGPWALDSGGFTELDRNGGWTMTAADYAAFVETIAQEVGQLEWCAPQDWMCEPHMLESTGRTIRRHQESTVRNFIDLRERLGPLVVPVLQGWERDDYLRCIELYRKAGVRLEDEPLVGLGTVCRRQSTREAAQIVRALAGEEIRLHGFGVKLKGLSGRFAYRDALASCDSLAWSFAARQDMWKGRSSCDPARRKCCNGCLHYALEWLDRNRQVFDPDVKPLWEEVPA